MKTARKTFAIVLLALTLPIWLLQSGVRNVMSFDTLYEFSKTAERVAKVRLFEFDEVYDAGRFLTSLAGFAKFFEALIIPFGIIVGILILRNLDKKKITFIPGCVLSAVILFNLFTIISASVINNIEIIDITADILYYAKVDIKLSEPVINTLSATIGSALISIPAIGFLTCGILDIMYLKNNPETDEKASANPNFKKAGICYIISIASVVLLLLIASFISGSYNKATIDWIFQYFWQGYFILVVIAIVFGVLGNKLNPSPKIKKTKKSAQTPVQISVQQSTSADELKKYKDLLDMGAITQEEFDAKKKQLLGL